MSDETVSRISSLFEDAVDGSTSSNKATIDYCLCYKQMCMGSILCCQQVVGVFFPGLKLCYCSPTALHPNFTKVVKLNGRRRCINMIILAMIPENM